MSDTITNGSEDYGELLVFTTEREAGGLGRFLILKHRETDREHISWIGKKEAYSLETLKKQTAKTAGKIRKSEHEKSQYYCTGV